MKPLIFVSILMFAALPLLAAADQPLARDVQVTLEKAIANEREAIDRYKAFAAKADDEGYPGAAALFRAMAQSEQIHAGRFEAILREHGVTVPPAGEPRKPLVSSTATNLRTAATNETAERDGMYRDAMVTCEKNGDSETAKVFDQTRDVEVEHANLCSAAARNLDGMKQAKTYYICDHCGYTTDVRLPLCPDCMHKDKVHPAGQ